MRVRRLEVQGFKSFKDKTVIEFDHSITGIVGPNGCGKSNIVDAFFWVMGEQSYKHMRGSGSGDLIFNGSSKYSPLGMAEATLVLETTEVDQENYPTGASASNQPLKVKLKEIAVTRRVYRDGQGEYFINGVPARLKDIKELFMDTGVGAKGYSVIEQGQIGKIVNSKPEDRRVLIEEAAGIAKYKARKQESLRKLEAAHSNLSRLNDILKEIERTLESLDRQAQKARKYREYKKELLEKEIHWGRRKAKVIQTKTDELKIEKSSLEQELVGVKSQTHTAENEIEADRIHQTTWNKDAEELQNKIQDLSRTLTHEQGALELSRRRQEDLARQLENMLKEKASLVDSIEAEKQKIATLESELAEAEKALSHAVQKALHAQDAVIQIRTAASLERERVEELRKQMMSSLSAHSDLSSQNATTQVTLQSYGDDILRLNNEKQTFESKLLDLNAQEVLLTSNKEDAKQKSTSLHHQKSQLLNELNTLETSLILSEKQKEEALKTVAQTSSRLESLRELAASFEGMTEGPKAILEWAKQNQSFEKFSVLGEMIQTEDGFDDVVECWLENKIETLVVEEADQALAALQHIKNQKSGRAAIYLKNTTQTTQAPDFELLNNELSLSGVQVLGLLSEKIKTRTADDGLARLISDWSSKVVIVDDLKPIISWLKNQPLQPAWTFVSISGETLEPTGLLHGGSLDVDPTASILKRRKTIEMLESKVIQAKLLHEETENTYKEIKEKISALKLTLDETAQKSQNIDSDLKSIEKDLAVCLASAQELTVQIQKIDSDLALKEEQKEILSLKLMQITQALSEQNEKKSLLELQISETAKDLEQKDETLKEHENELHQLRINEASLRERAVGLKRECLSVNSIVRDKTARVEEIHQACVRVDQEKQNHAGDDIGAHEKIGTLNQQISQLTQSLAEIKDQIEISNSRFTQNMEKIKNLHQETDLKSTKINSLALEIEKLNVEMNHLKQTLEEKYGENCLENTSTASEQQEMSAPIVTHEMTQEEEKTLFEEVERLRDRIRRLGEVNTMAIDEYEETKKRFDYLNGERQDLEQSITNLGDAIEHINKTSEERFKKAFEAISNRFEKLFPIIFGGGRAELSLVYPEGSTDILEAGVDILAQPPGKKVSTITLLSGGEKALTAIALIFAIFMVKPSPFCLLDEVDAPLDDSNIGKFNALLKEMAAKTQFILITHNKKTMELNDTLYGVTMEEPGVSKMVSIEMR